MSTNYHRQLYTCRNGPGGRSQRLTEDDQARMLRAYERCEHKPWLAALSLPYSEAAIRRCWESENLAIDTSRKPPRYDRAK